MKRYIKSSSEYPEYINIQHGRQKFSVHINTDGPYEGSFAAQISEIHPYDDAEYAWAKIGFNGQVIFYRNGKVEDKMQLAGYEPDDYEEQEYGTSAVDQYINDCLDIVATELLQMNRDVKPIMVHN